MKIPRITALNQNLKAAMKQFAIALKNYVRGDIHSNTIEGFFSTVKRSLNGIYHAVSKEHLHRYMSEYEFRYNNRYIDDGERTLAAIKGAEGKRLIYKQPIG